MPDTLHPALAGTRAVIFDAGGTLVHPDWPRLARLAAETCGGSEFDPEEMSRAMKNVLRVAGEELQKRDGVTPDEQQRRHWVFRKVYGALGLDEEMCERVVGRLDAIHAERHLWCGVDPDAARVLETLKTAGLRTAVISNTEDGRVREALEAAGLAAHFELLIDSHLVRIRKPDAGIFRLALEQLGVGAGEAAYVGDSYAHDALPALAVGMRAVLLDPLDLHPESVCPRVRSLGELINVAG